MVDCFNVRNTKLQNFLSYKDIDITASDDNHASITISIPSQYIIPVLANPGTRTWDISVGLQYATGKLILTGPGIKNGYVYTVRMFYFTV